jgi:hypothetical protein
LARSFAAGAQIRKTDDVHGVRKSGWIEFIRILKAQTDKA